MPSAPAGPRHPVVASVGRWIPITKDGTETLDIPWARSRMYARG